MRSISRGAFGFFGAAWLSRILPSRPFCFSRIRNVATPRLFARRYATHACASAVVSTTT